MHLNSQGNNTKLIICVSTWKPLFLSLFFEDRGLLGHTESETSSKMQCKICDINFTNKSGYHIHTKQKHKTLIIVNMSCWVSHDERNQSDNAEKTADKQEVIQRIFEIMEKKMNELQS